MCARDSRLKNDHRCKVGVLLENTSNYNGTCSITDISVLNTAAKVTNYHLNNSTTFMTVGCNNSRKINNANTHDDNVYGAVLNAQPLIKLTWFI